LLGLTRHVKGQSVVVAGSESIQILLGGGNSSLPVEPPPQCDHLWSVRVLLLEPGSLSMGQV
jgi:hypothetical protein